MLRHVTMATIVLALLPATVSQAYSQERLDVTGLEINGHGGVAFLNELEQTEFFAGGTALLHFGSGLAIAGTVDWVSTTVEDGDEGDRDATIWYYSGELVYGFASVSQAQFYGFLGGGVAEFQPGSELEDAGAETESNAMVPLGVGVRWFNDKLDASWGANLEFRDRVIYIDEEEDKVANDWSITIGLSLVLGG